MAEENKPVLTEDAPRRPGSPLTEQTHQSTLQNVREALKIQQSIKKNKRDQQDQGSKQ